MTEFKYIVGDQIRKIRKHKGMTQERLAERSGLSFSYISDVERGTRNISLESLEKIIQALGVAPVQLFEDMPVLKKQIEDHELQYKLDDLNSLLHNRDSDEIDYVLKMAREFLRVVDRKKND